MHSSPRVVLVGGPDVDARLPLMHRLKDDFNVSAVGSLSALHHIFSTEGFGYSTYCLSRQVNPVSDLLTLGQLVFIFRRLKPQIVHAFDPKPCVFARLAARFAGIPVVVGTLPGLGSLYVNPGLTYQIVRSIYETLQRPACHLSDITIFHNRDDAREFVERGLVPEHKAIVVAGSGVRTDVFSRDAIREADIELLRAELNLSPSHIVITIIARLRRSKGIMELMEAARMVKHYDDNVRFLLVGPNDRDSVDRLSSDELRELSRLVACLGQRQDIPAILALTDIFVLPSYREGMPRVLLEAASMGLPIITTDAPGCSEVVEDGVNGLLVPVRESKALAQAILRLVGDSEMRRRLGRESRQRAVARFDLSAIADQIRSIYRELLAQKGLLPEEGT